MLVERTVKQFVEDVASDSPAPGGGSVSALSSALGASLAIMACKITLKKQPNQMLEHLVSVLEKQKTTLVGLVDEDTAAFNLVMAAFALPKNNDEEKDKRKAAIQESFKVAAKTPLKTMQTSLEVLENCAVVAKECSPNVASDIGVAIETSNAGLLGAFLNVRINLNAIKDLAFVEEVRKKASEIEEKAESARNEAMALIEEKL